MKYLWLMDLCPRLHFDLMPPEVVCFVTTLWYGPFHKKDWSWHFADDFDRCLNLIVPRETFPYFGDFHLYVNDVLDLGLGFENSLSRSWCAVYCHSSDVCSIFVYHYFYGLLFQLHQRTFFLSNASPVVLKFVPVCWCFVFFPVLVYV